MAWDWLKDNNDEPNEFKPIDARGLLDGKEYHDYWTTKLHNGLANVPKSLLGAVESIPAMAARTRPVVMQELENDLDGTDLMDSDADKAALSDVESQIKGTTAPIWEGARLGVKSVKDALPDANWESNVDESQLSYPKKIGGMIVENAPLMAAQLAASIINPALGVGLMAGSIAGDAYNDLTEKGVDPLTAGQAGWLDAAAQAPLEGVGEMGWLKAFRELGTEGAAKLMGKAFVKEGLTEAVQEFPDETIPYIAEHGSLDGFDWSQLASNAVDAGVVGGIYGGGFAGIGRAINGKADEQESTGDDSASTALALVDANTTSDNAGGNNAAASDVGNSGVTRDADGTVTIDAANIASPAMHAMNRIVNELGISPTAASGIVGGLMHESGGDTTDISTTAKNPTSGAYGIAQWLGSRYDDLVAFAEENNADPNDLDTQISFIVHELKGKESGALQEILKAQTPDEAGRLADQFYERSEGTDEIRNRKASNAQKIYDMFMNGGADPSATHNGSKNNGVPNPKSAEDFLKDLEETLPADTDEDVEKLNAIRKAIQGKNKKAQEELAAQYGWGENAPETAQDASEGAAQENVQAGNPDASKPVNSPSKAEAISKNPKQTNVTAAPTIDTKPQAGNSEANTLSTVRTGSPRNGGTNLPTAPRAQAPINGTSPVAHSAQGASLPAAPAPLQLPPANTTDKNGSRAQVPQAKIEKARGNQRLKELVKQAFVDGDKDALARLGAMQINPDVLEAVKNDVLGAHQSPLALPASPVPAKGTTVGTAAPIALPPAKAPNTAIVSADKPTSTNAEDESAPSTDSNAKSNISEKENDHENTKKNQPVHHSEENKNVNAKPEQSKPSEGKDGETPEGKNPVKKAPSKETPSSGKKEEPQKTEQKQDDKVVVRNNAADNDARDAAQTSKEIGNIDAKASNKAKTFLRKINKCLVQHRAGSSTGAETIDRIRESLRGKSFANLPEAVKAKLNEYAEKKIEELKAFDKEHPWAEKEATDYEDSQFDDAKDMIDRIVKMLDSGVMTLDEAIERANKVAGELKDMAFADTGAPVSHAADRAMEYFNQKIAGEPAETPKTEQPKDKPAKAETQRIENATPKAEAQKPQKAFRAKDGDWAATVKGDVITITQTGRGLKKADKITFSVTVGDIDKSLGLSANSNAALHRLVGERLGQAIRQWHVDRYNKLKSPKTKAFIDDWDTGGKFAPWVGIQEDSCVRIIRAAYENITGHPFESDFEKRDRERKERNQSNDAKMPKAEQPKIEPAKPGAQDTENATPKVESKEGVFGSVEDADRDLEGAFGLTPKAGRTQEKPAPKSKEAKDEIHKKHRLVDDSDEAIQGYIDEFIKKTRNLNSGFDPTILVPVFKICAAYTQRGVAKFADFASKTIAAFKSKGVKKEEIEPWLAPAWEAVKSFPDTGKKFDAKKLVVALKAVGARYESGLKTADAVKDDIRSKYGDKAASTLNDYIDASFRGVQAYFGDGENANPEPSKAEDKTGADLIDYAFNQGGIINEDAVKNLTPSQTDAVLKIFNKSDDSAVDNADGNGTMKKDDSKGVPVKEKDDVRGREQGSSRPVEVGKPGKSGAGGEGEQRATRGNSETPDRDGGRERGPDTESDEPKNEGTGGSRELGRGQAEDGTRMERTNGEGTSAGGTKKPVISPKADKVEADIAKGKVKDARDVPGNDYIAKPVSPDAKGASKTQRVDNNIAAIKLLKKIESENRMATPAEQEILAGYSGWGGLGSEMKSDAKRMAQLKELLTEEEYNAAERELLTAFYTPPFVISRMWELAEHLGFKGGRVLDPSCGVGSFFSLMPASLRERSTALQGVELSPIPARIAKQLYQSKKFKIDNQDYTKFDRGNGFYDLAITNVPFSNSVKASVPAMRDSDGGVHKSLLIHDYYFAQTLDKVRPGGLIVFMTSSGTMDRKAGYDNALLRHLSSRAKLVGIVRLPNTLFAPSANVGTDIVVFRKLNEGENPDTVDATNGWTNSLTLVEARDDEGRHNYARINGYYEDNPENIIGEPVLVSGRYGGRDVEFHTSNNAETDKKLGEVIARLPENVYVPRVPVKINTPSHVKELAEVEDGQNVDDIVKGKDGQWGRVVIDDNGEQKLKPFAKNAQAKVGAFKELGDLLNDVLEKQVDAEVSEEELASARDKLNKQYDAFVKKYGHVNDLVNARLFAGSPTAGRVLALEHKYQAGKKGQKSTAEKAPILTKRTAYPTTDDINISTISDALASSLRKFGYVDTKYIANALSKDEDSVVRELGDRLFRDPISEQYVTRDEYLSGNVRQKLAFAEDAARTDPEYERNVTELRAVIPKDIGISDISIELGSPILSVEDTQSFVDHLAGQANAIELRYNPVTSTWEVKKGARYYAIPYQREVTMYGVEAVTRDDDDIRIVDVIRAMLNGGVLSERGMFKAKDTDTEEVRKARSQAAAKVPILFKKINQELKEWIVSNGDVKNRVETSYNNRFNATVPRVYDGSLLTFSWIDDTSPIRPRVHQANVVWRTINEKSVLYAHCVGSGKTLSMQAAGMELKRMGLANKIVYTVPKNVVKQFEIEFYQICPHAKLLVLDSTTLPDDVKSVEFDVKPVMVKNNKGKLIQEKDADGIPVFKKEPVSKEEAEKRRVLVAKRNATLNKILTHDWDGIIMSHQTFERLPLSDDYIEKFLNEQIAQYRRALEAEQIANGGRGKKSRSLKDIQDALSKLEGKLKELITSKEARDFASPSFESLGIDQVFVDEADLFKNLQTQTKLGQVKGISTSASGRSFDMFMKSQYLLHSPSAHGVVFATGTPISNSVTELYTMCRYLANDELAKLGIDSFDQFAKTFIDIGQGEVPKQDGSGYEYKNMVLGLKNAPECLKIFRSFADVQMAQDLPEITKKRPTAHRITSVVKESAWIRRFKKEIRARSAAIRASSRHDPPMINSRSKKSKEQFAKTGEYIQVADSPLVLAKDFKTATLAPFLIDNSLTGEEGYGKVWKCADNVYSEWKNSSVRRGAQLVFCDLSTPTNDGTLNVYDALKSRLVELGIPESDIAFVQDAKTDSAREALFKKVDNGEIRILIGSTMKMGAGTNMQHKLVALHHLDCPWRPRDIEQREGRIIRQGNENKDVNIYNYVAEGTYDANLWDLVRSKADTITQIMRGDASTRDADTEVVDSDNFEQLAELANADPDQKRYLQVGKELRELEAAKSAFDKSKETAKLILASYPEQVEAGKAAIKNVEADIETVSKTSAKDFSITIGGSVYSNRNEANEAFVKEKERVAKEYAKILYRYKDADPKLQDAKIGTIRGLDVYVSGNNPYFKSSKESASLAVYIKGKETYGVATPTALGVWNSAQTQPPAKLKGLTASVKQKEADIEEARKAQNATFDGGAKIATLQKEYEELRTRIDKKAQQQRERDNARPVEIELYERDPFSDYDFDSDDPDVYTINMNIVEGLKESMRDSGADTGTVSFDKPGGWDKFKKKFIDKTNWAVYSNENTIEITASQKDLNDLYEAIESQEETKYSLSQGGKRISHEEMTKQTLSAFPNAQNIEVHDSGVSFDLPNGSHVEVNFTDDTISVDRAKAQKDYGGTLKGNEKASGKIEMVDKDALITLTMDSPDETVSHEAMHLAWNLLTDKERNALLRTYGSEEGAAEGMREWKIRRKMKQGTIAGKIMQKISDMAHKLLSLFHENDQHVFQKLESGEMWERGNENNTAARNVKYKMNPINEAEKYLKSHKDFGEKAGSYIDRTFRPDLAKAKANANISVNEPKKKTGWGAVDTALNNTVRSPSRIKSAKTNYIWGLADTAQRELQELRGKWTHSFAGAIKNLNSKEKERYTDILWEEDMKQHVFSDKELRDAGVSEKVIKAHQKTRSLLGRIYNAVNAVYTRERIENFTYKTRKEAEEAKKELAKRPHTFVMHDIRETVKDGKPAFQVSIKTGGYREVHSVVTAEEMKKLDTDKDVYIKSRKQLDDGSFKVSYLAYNKPLANMEGYMPHIFHGVLIVKKYVGEDGNTQSKVVGSAESIDKAVVKADAMQKEEGGEFIIAPKEFSSEGEIENPLLLGDMDYFKLMENLRKGASLTLDEAREMTHATMKGRHVYYGAKKHRKGAEGFEKNAIWVIQHHIDSSSRYVALDPFKQKAISFFERAFGDYDKDWTGEAAFCKGYIDSVLGKPSRLETLANDFLRLFPWFKNEARPARRIAGNLTGLTGVLKLGASLSSGFVNTLQLFNCVGYVGARKTAVGLKRALHPNATDKKILVASGVSEESGLALDSVGHINAEGTALSKAGNIVNRVNDFLMKPFTFAEKTIRKATILAAYYKAIGDGLSKGEAIQYARDINRKVNFDYSVADAPRIFRALQGTVIGDMALQFQKYGVKEMEVISDFLPVLGNTTAKQKLEFFLPYLLVSGIWNAFPFEDALLSLLKLFGFDDPEKEAKRAMMEWAGNNPDRKALVNVANYGAGSLAGVDISQRVGLKGVVPETSNIVTGGPLGSTTVQLAKAVLNGDTNGAMKAVSPALGNVYGAVAGYNTDSKGRKTVDYDAKDRIVRGVLGFRTIKEANATDAQGIIYNYKEQKKNDRAKAKSEYLKDPSSGNRQKLKEMGYSNKEIKALKDGKKSTRVERSQTGLSKEDKKKLKPVFDYVQ